MTWRTPNGKAAVRRSQDHAWPLDFTASGTEARRAETAQTGSVHDGPVAKPDAPTCGEEPA